MWKFLRYLINMKTALFLILVLIPFFQIPVYPMECFISPIEENYERADLVFTGKVTNISTVHAPEKVLGEYYTLNTFEISNNFKGLFMVFKSFESI